MDEEPGRGAQSYGAQPRGQYGAQPGYGVPQAWPGQYPGVPACVVQQIKQRGEAGDGMAIAGIVLGWVGLGTLLLVLLLGVSRASS